MASRPGGDFAGSEGREPHNTGGRDAIPGNFDFMERIEGTRMGILQAVKTNDPLRAPVGKSMFDKNRSTVETREQGRNTRNVKMSFLGRDSDEFGFFKRHAPVPNEKGLITLSEEDEGAHHIYPGSSFHRPGPCFRGQRVIRGTANIVPESVGGK